MSIKQKLLLILTVLGLTMAANVGATLFAESRLDASMDTIVADRVVPLQQLKAIADAYLIDVQQTAQRVATGGLSLADGKAGYAHAKETIATTWTAYLATYLTPEEHDLAETAKTVMASAQGALDKLGAIYAAEDMTALQTFSDGPLITAIVPVNTALNALVDLQGRVALAEYGQSQDLMGWLTIVSWVLMAVSAITMIAAAVVVLRTVAARLIGMEGALRAVADGDLSVHIPSSGDRDEIGRIADAAEVFRQNGEKIAALTASEAEKAAEAAAARQQMMSSLQEAFGTVVSAASAGDFTKRVAETFPDAELNGLARAVNTLVVTVDTGLSETGKVVSALSRTDLTQRITGTYQGDFARLKDDVNTLADSLSDIVGQLQGTSRGMKTAMSEILSGANDLADRTTKQAAAIEETTAAIEQLSTTVSENARRAENASAASGAVSATAEKTGEVMDKSNAAMERISASSSKISNIIGMIDDIAFQTNLLALNASVEAARAGDAGKGFAVVAVEVRRLAQSAAQASSEVKVLIEESAGDVTAGSRLVADATRELVAMVESIKSSAALIQDIAAASQDQAASIGQVTTAIRQMDEMTQHNAALVEETNAAIEQTENRARDLDRIVDQFVLEPGPAHADRTDRAAGPVSRQPAAPVVAPPAPAATPARKAVATKAHATKTVATKIGQAAQTYLSKGNVAINTDDWAEF